LKKIIDRHSSAASADPAEGHSAGARFALALLRVYKFLISPYFRGSCRFLPSCADYAQEAVLRHGAVAGGWLALRRLARCHPLSKAGHDPVPPVLAPPARIG
jgi:putative membrane protein insertion efficiency factor